MRQQILIIFCLILATTACFGGRDTGQRENLVAEVLATPVRTSVQNVQLVQSGILPPYGLKVKAETATLTVQVSTSKKETTEKLADIQQAINQVETAAANDDQIELAEITINGIGGSSDRSLTTDYSLPNLDTSAVTLKLTTRLADHDDQLLETLIAFNNFLDHVELTKTITLQALSISTDLGDLEPYRQQLIAQIYQELAAVQAEYDETVDFEVTGLHGRLQIMPLTNTDYYIFLEPTITVKQF